MGNGAVWVAAFTGATAVLASWVTNLGNVRAARAQAEASALAQQRGRVRELRRAAYLDVMEQAHITGELYWRVGDAYVQLTEGEQRLARTQEPRTELRSAYEPLMRSVRVVALEGPADPADTAQFVLESAAEANRALWRVALGEPDARARFDEAQAACVRCLGRFVEAAREAMSAS